jgi:high-affinity nickel permease
MAGSLFFTMGDSILDVAGMVSVTAVAIALSRRFQQFEAISGCVATGTSTLVLLGIGMVNLAIFAHVRVRFGQTYRSRSVNQPGIRANCQFQRPIYRHLQIFYMVPPQFTFRLGLGGVTEVLLLGTLSARAAARTSMLSGLVPPTLFAVALGSRTRAFGLSATRLGEPGFARR